MSNSKTNNGRQLPSKEGLPSTGTNQQSHFVHARQIIKSWPEWKRSISCAPISSNGSQTTKHSSQSE
jgi:hypothetical protein